MNQLLPQKKDEFSYLLDATSHLLVKSDLWLCLAESCTGGLLGSRITDIPGSSRFFLGGIVGYAYEVKTEILKVPLNTLLQHGAVSSETAQQMASSVRNLFASATHPLENIIALSITGIAGPDGGTTEKPVGLVWMGVASRWGEETRQYRADGGRLDNKTIFTDQALILLLDHLSSHLKKPVD